MQHKIKLIALFGLLLGLLVACNKQPEFTVEGQVKDAAGETIILERRGFSDVSVIDSVKVASDGTFKLKGVAPENPDLYLLKLGNQVINIAVDSIEAITINSDKASFAVSYSVSGSEGTSRMKDVVLAKAGLQKSIDDLKKQYENKTISADDYLASLKESLDKYKSVAKNAIIADLKSPAAYFTLFQKIGDDLIFDPYEKSDSRMYSAVATSWDTYYKGTPRAKHLREFTLSSIKVRQNAENRLNLSDYIKEAKGSDFYNIELPDIHNNKVSLASLKGKVVLLDFTAYQTDFSPLHNIVINKIYEKYKDRFTVYQVSFDPDLHFWQNAGINLPWVCVRDAELLSSELVRRFNLQELPTSFILNIEGEIVKRLSPKDDYEKELKKLL